jgi:hypothetical protein
MTSVRRLVLAAAVLVTVAAASGLARGAAQQALPAVTVYKDPNCGCCSLWVRHMEQSGFTVTAHDTADMPAIRAKHGVPAHVQSCHMGVVAGYVIEGHIPADDVKRLLTERPKVKGIAVPGMPVGSPGMEQGNVRHAYSVLTFDDTGRTTVFARH